MKPKPDYSLPILNRVLYASDFAAGSEAAFQHALKAALVAKASFTIIHVTPGVAADWMTFPGVRETLERWELLSTGSPSSPAPQLGIEISTVVATQENPVKTVLRFLKAHPVDFIVLAAQQHEGRASWLRHSAAQPVARKSGQTTLFLPDKAAGFVSARDGTVSLKRILIPITSVPDPQPAVEAAVRLVHRLHCPGGTFALLHVGERENMPEVRCPAVPGWQWKKLSRTGDVIHGIVDTANKQKANLIVMSTNGRNGFLDALRGSHSERVLHTARCPLLTVPEGSTARRRL
jgi:nucleotide-binding universal stress UspA family protein